MKTMCRDIVKFHYRAELDPEIEYGHNSNEREQVIVDNIKKLMDDSLFLQGPPDFHVSSFVINDQPIDAL